MKINFKKPYALVYGSSNGAAYSQDGKDFTAGGDLIGEDKTTPILPKEVNVPEIVIKPKIRNPNYGKNTGSARAKS